MGKRDRQRSQPPGSRPPAPRDASEMNPEYAKGQRHMVNLKPGRTPDETVGDLVVADRRAPKILIEGVPPHFRPDQSMVEVEVVWELGPKTVRAKIVEPQDVVKAAESAFADTLQGSAEFWKDKSVNVSAEDFRLKGNRPPKVWEVDIRDTDNDYQHLPINVRVPGLPEDWNGEPDPVKVDIFNVQVRDGRRITGTGKVEGFEEAPRREDDKLERLKRKMETENWNAMRMDREDVAELRQVGKNWVSSGWMPGEFDFDLYLDVPRDWNPTKVEFDEQGQVVVKLKNMTQRGGTLIVFGEIEQPGKGAPAGTAAADGKKVDDKIKDKGGSSKEVTGKSIAGNLKSLVPAETLTSIQPQLEELDSPALNQPSGLERRLGLVRAIIPAIEVARAALAADSLAILADDKALDRLRALRAERERVEAEANRIQTEIDRARATLEPEAARMTAAQAAERAERQRVVDELTPRVENDVQALHLRASLELDGVTDVDTVRRQLAETQAVVAMREAWLSRGVPPRKAGDPDYRAIEYVTDFLLAERMIPVLERKIVELEAVAKGMPVPVEPVPLPDTGAPGPVPVGERRAPETPSVGETLPSPADQLAELRQLGFEAGERIRLLPEVRGRLAGLFGLAEPLPAGVSILNMNQDEVTLTYVDAPQELVIGLEVLYAAARQMDGLASQLEQAKLVTNIAIQLDNEATNTLLVPRLKEWLAAHVGETSPQRFRVVGVDITRGALTLDAVDLHEYLRIELPLEEVVPLLPEHIRITGDLDTLRAEGGREPTLERLITPPPPPGEAKGRAAAEPRERPELFPGVMEGQIYTYSGTPSRHLESGANFIVSRLDRTRGVVFVTTAAEAAEAYAGRREPRTWLVQEAQWPRLMQVSRFKSGPQAPPLPAPDRVPTLAAPRPTAREAAVERAAQVVTEVKPGDVYVYLGQDRGALKKNIRMTVVEVVTEPPQKIKVQVPGHPNVLVLRADQWGVNIRVQKVEFVTVEMDEGEDDDDGDGPDSPPEPSTPPIPPGTPDGPPPPPSRPPSTPPAGVLVGATIEPVSSSARTVVPRTEIHPVTLEDVETINDLLLAVHATGILDKVRSAIKDAAGFFGGVALGQFDEALERIGQVNFNLPAALSINERLTRQADAAGREGIRDNLRTTGDAARYRERQFVHRVSQQLQQFLSGEGNPDMANELQDAIEVIEEVEKQVRTVNEKSRDALQPRPRPTGTGKKRTSGSA